MSVFLISTLLLAKGQQTPIKRRSEQEAVMQDSRPVTSEEAKSVFNEVRVLLNKGVHASLPQTSLTASAQPISREKIIGEMTSILGGLQPQIKFTPKAQGFSEAVLKVEPSKRHELVRLIKLGYVGKVSHLATGPKDTLTIREFGDAIGFFISRAAEVTHLPSPKWSPILGAGSR